jgi:hypothetical protein
VWQPLPPLLTLSRRNAVSICVGHYAAAAAAGADDGNGSNNSVNNGVDNGNGGGGGGGVPDVASLSPLTLELVDPSVSGVRRSPLLSKAQLDALCPLPSKFVGGATALVTFICVLYTFHETLGARKSHQNFTHYSDSSGAAMEAAAAAAVVLVAAAVAVTSRMQTAAVLTTVMVVGRLFMHGRQFRRRRTMYVLAWWQRRR